LRIPRYVKGTAAIAAAALLISCSSGSAPEDGEQPTSIKVAIPAEPASMDPHVTGNYVVGEMGRPVFESLLTTDSAGEVQPMLAESYEVSEDGKQITFSIREGLQFHDGSELDVDDVVASMERWTRLTV